MMGRCSSCDASLPEGSDGCQVLVEALWARDFGDYRYFRSHRLMMDAYSVQHPDRYCISAKSLAAHLGGLGCAFVHGGQSHVYEALQRWLNGTPALSKPALPAARGELTIEVMEGVADPESYARAAERWGRSVWEAHASLHPLVRQWLQEALAGRQPTE